VLTPHGRGTPLLTEPPPFKWGDRYDVVGLALRAALLAALVLVGAPVLLAIVSGCAAMNLAAYALRQQAGIPQVTLWQRWRHARR
jgi:hypothetical protein